MMLPSEYNILRLKVEKQGQIVRFMHRLPAHLTVCTGVKLSLPLFMRGVAGTFVENRIAYATIEFNNKRYLTNLPLESESREFNPLCVPLEEPMVTGYLIDSLPHSHEPYEVLLYFRCTRKENITP